MSNVAPGKAFKPMLAHPTKSLQEVLNRFGKDEFACEWKYDGERIQIHRSIDGKIKLFSRNLNDTTEKFPDVISRMPTCVKSDVKDFIVEGEVVAWDKDKETILPFQTLSTRKRKNVGAGTIKVQVIVFLFDLMYVNGKSTIDKSLHERRKLLKEHFFEVTGSVVFVQSIDTADIDEINGFFEESIRGNCEGLMLKTLNTPYEVGKRSRNWLKLKKDYLDGLGDTVDLVVIGGYKGEGKRQGVYGAYLLATYDSEKKEYQTICKIGTGFSDDVLKQQFKDFGRIRVNAAPSNYLYHHTLTPDHWFQPKAVWEVKAYGLTISPKHYAAVGKVDKTKGFSLRFPRFLRARDDKDPKDATSPEQLVEMWKTQEDAGSFKMTGNGKKSC